MTTNDIQAGAIVRLRPRGFPMRVRSVLERYVLCAWLDEAGVLQVKPFPLAALELLPGADESALPPTTPSP